MKTFDARAYSIADFLEWSNNGLLDLSPKFQRRGVWTRAAKSYLIDTIIRGKPMPKVLLTQELLDKKNVRTVIDGQQRIRTIIEFVAGGFTVLKAHNAQFAGVHFADLDEDIKTTILQYEVGVDLLYNVSLSEMLDIFARINTYSVTLNRQEQLNAKYLGVFKISAYELGHAYISYILDGGILTEKQISRMGEAQLASDLLVAMVDGVQTIKNIERLYKKFESFEVAPAQVEEGVVRYHKAMKFVGALYKAEELASTNWSRPHWFYTLFTCVAHALEPIKGLEACPRPKLSAQTVLQWRSSLDELSALYTEYTEDEDAEVPNPWLRFINYAQRRTTDTEARVERARFVLSKIEDDT
ncbi:DUF262 domain-containing protein [Agrobacterium sp. CNPSo 3708]|uniref:DUF262 domain-containing protein n=1 Tax=Agrobacterium sp. CNPSo 3708 TaxID=3028150 RepID=UPI002363F7BC|nr:DUF262 domain-containing protein [Agrobacterium sp. CNPSo 3708]MDD1497611.1 DUF262 domain-containing protein [Agrobacterium sp. CNPSo 3708]